MNKQIGLGTWSWGNKLIWNYQEDNDEELRCTLLEALKRGFSFVDTADSYGTGKLKGRSESLLGNFLNDLPAYKKNKIEIATKLAPYPWRIGNKGFNSPYFESAKRLKDRLDIVQLHWSTAIYNPWQDYQLLNNLCDLNDCGFQFKIGLSNIGPERLKKIINFLSKRGKKIYCVQVQYSLLSPNIDKQRLVQQICFENQIKFLAYSPLAFGILSKKRNEAEMQKDSIVRKFIFSEYMESTFALRTLIKKIADARSVSPAQVAVNWCCYQGAIPIVGLRKKSHVIDISNIFSWDLTVEEFDQLESLSKECSKKMPSNPFSSS